MPIVHRNSTSNGIYSLAIWLSNEPLDDLLSAVQLHPSEKEYYGSLKNEQRQREFLTVRRLLEHLCGQEERIIYDEFGKPRLASGGYVSITHSKALVGLIVSPVAEVGIDLEAFRPHIAAIAPKFIAQREQAAFGDQLNTETMHLLWGAKEVLFKLYGKGEIDFKKDLFVEPPNVDTKQVIATLTKNEYRLTAKMQYTLLESFMLVWSCLHTEH